MTVIVRMRHERYFSQISGIFLRKFGNCSVYLIIKELNLNTNNLKTKIKLTSEIFRNLEYNLANIIISKALSNENLNKSNQELGRLIYHYSSLQSFLSIIQSQTLFCTNLNYLNDKKEYKFGVEQVLEVVDKLIKENFACNILNNFDNEIEEFYKSERYVTCFSRNGDLLSQWRAYANQGKGVAIGFDLLNFEDSIHQHLKGSVVEYNEDVQKKSIEEVIKTIIEYYEYHRENIDWSDFGYEKLVRYSIIDFLHRIVSTYKSKGFSEEQEFRFEYFIDGNINKIDSNEINFRSTETMIIPYIILETEYNNYKKRFQNEDLETEPTFLNKKLPIKEIIIGPSLDFDLTKSSIEEILLQHDYKNVEIKKSAIPYRI